MANTSRLSPKPVKATSGTSTNPKKSTTSTQATTKSSNRKSTTPTSSLFKTHHHRHTTSRRTSLTSCPSPTAIYTHFKSATPFWPMKQAPIKSPFTHSVRKTNSPKSIDHAYDFASIIFQTHKKRSCLAAMATCISSTSKPNKCHPPHLRSMR